MPSPRSASLMMVLLSMVIACANIWVAAVRSTIPIALSGKVVQKQRLTEKTPGVDDVYLVTLSTGQRLQIDRHLYDLISQGQRIEKAAWASRINIDDRAAQLTWSRDLRGMATVMPLAVMICIIVGRTSISGPGIDGKDP